MIAFNVLVITKVTSTFISPATFHLSYFFLPSLTQSYVKLLHILIFLITTCLGYRKILLPHLSSRNSLLNLPKPGLAALISKFVLLLREGVTRSSFSSLGEKAVWEVRPQSTGSVLFGQRFFYRDLKGKRFG